MENSAELTYEQKQNEFALKQELEKTIHVWVERTFNFIQVRVLEKYCDNELNDYIRNLSLEEAFYDWLLDCDCDAKIKSWIQESSWNTDDTEFDLDDLMFVDNLMSNFKKTEKNHDGTLKETFEFAFGENKWDEFKEWCCHEFEDDITDWIYDQENYPMWNTCFEFRDSFYNSEEDIQKCVSVGVGVIEGLDDFNNILFMTSAGHSFYSAYWIPLYFKFFPSEAEKYAGIDYSDL
jgi:hypothetical protein